jgi:hypothetical protein
MHRATYSHEFDGRRFQLPIRRDDDFRREIIELGLRVSFALAQENDSSLGIRPLILSDRFMLAGYAAGAYAEG